MTTSALAAAASTSSTQQATQDAAAAQLSGNFNTFLTLLTTQLQNQDPTNPMDSNQFTQELVEFSGVEQQINTNDNLKTLISLQQGNATTAAVSYLGKTIAVTNGNASLTGGEADWSYALGSDAAKNTLTVTDSSGQTVYTKPGETGSGQHDFDWDGTNNVGGPPPADGVYTLTVNATASDGSAVEAGIASKGVVTEINLTGSTPYLMVGSMAVPLSAVSAVETD